MKLAERDLQGADGLVTLFGTKNTYDRFSMDFTWAAETERRYSKQDRMMIINEESGQYYEIE